MEEEILTEIKQYQRVLFVEEGIKTGGLAQYVGAELLERKYSGEYRIRAVENRFVPHASPVEATALCRLDSMSLINDYQEFFK